MSDALGSAAGLPRALGSSIPASPETPNVDTLTSSVMACTVGSTKLNSDTLSSISTSVLAILAKRSTLAHTSVPSATKRTAQRLRSRVVAASAMSASRARRPSASSRSAGTSPLVRIASVDAPCICAASRARSASASVRARAMGVVNPLS